MPGLLNHLTGTLNEIESMKEETKILMSTIRLPRRLGQITERMPASNYERSVRSDTANGDDDKRVKIKGEAAVENK